MDENDLKRQPSDIAHTIVKSGISAIPFVGSPAAELFSQIIIPPISKRRDKWIIEIAKGLNELKDKINSFKIEDLSKNDLFISNVMNSTQIAIRNHDEKKINALKNAVLNTAINISIPESLQMIFINLIDLFTPWHIIILKYFQNPNEWYDINKITRLNWTMGGPSHALEHAMPELKGKKDFYNRIVKDLYSNGLLTIETLHVTMSVDGMFTSRTTDFGNDFIKYISDPEV